ncbi:hypothetical protein [Paludibacterium denitrificans]|uniref:Uncharacterized protein n=1 Tax=Paludibacterium denitrificans TaxID=2675226 RepID=A0A844GGI3_9NEIS|nr:hypothetical protein [Paludibacterium denitrificans]MTD33997.1 hypothetical protein [Paludibacterium denitrificans]
MVDLSRSRSTASFRRPGAFGSPENKHPVVLITRLRHGIAEGHFGRNHLRASINGFCLCLASSCLSSLSAFFPATLSACLAVIAASEIVVTISRFEGINLAPISLADYVRRFLSALTFCLFSLIALVPL